MNFGTISPREIDSYLFKPDYILIDIRTPRDFRRQHIKGAVCIPYEDLQERVRLLRHKTASSPTKAGIWNIIRDSAPAWRRKIIDSGERAY